MSNYNKVFTSAEVSGGEPRDRIAQTYLGQHGSRATVDKARRRIDWMAQQAYGERVLDIGCSQGILPILLAREGFTVVGIDIDPMSIAHAKALAAAEPASVTARLHFEVCDAVTFAHGCSSREASGRTTAFDTVVLGEVLEHLNHPDQMVDVAARLLRGNGRIVVTTPLGHWPHPDHRQDFTLSELRRVLSRYCSCRHLSVVDGYVRFVGEAHPTRNDLPLEDWVSADRLLALTEAALLETQRQLRGELKDLRNRFDVVSQAVETAQADLDRVRSVAASFERLSIKSQEEIRNLRTAMDKELSDKQEELRTLNSFIEDRSAKEQEQLQLYKTSMEKELANKQQERDSLKKALDRARLERDNAHITAEKLRRKLHRSFGYRLRKLAKRAFNRAQSEGHAQITGLLPKGGSRANGSSAEGPTTPLPQERAGHSHMRQEARIEAVTITTSVAPSRPIRPSHGLVVAPIMDEMSTACFAPECRLIEFTPSSWRQTLEQDPPELLLVESAWRGGRGSWQYKVAKYTTSQGDELLELVRWCRSRGVPTVFWNKEDPVHFHRFLESARLFDFVFTSDAESVLNYQRNGVVSAAPLLFAAQPMLHHPIQPEPRLLTPCFAGSYYANRHDDRRRQVSLLLEAARPFGLVIYDRNYGTEGKDFQWPDSLRSHILGGIPYDEMADVYRKYAVVLNVNSVVTSSTMLSRRVFELLGCGTAVVSTYSAAIERLFGETIPMVKTAAEAEVAIRAVIEDSDHRRRLARNGLRQVMLRHTYEHRLQEILGRIGFIDRRCPSLGFAVAVGLRDVEEARRTVENLKNQTVQPQAVLAALPAETAATPIAEVLAQGLPSVRVVLSTIGDDHKLPPPALASLGEPWLAAIHPQLQLGPHHFEDLLAATVYTKADVIGSGDAYRYVQTTSPLGALMKIDLVARFGWPREPEWGPRLFAHGVRSFIVDAEVSPTLSPSRHREGGHPW